MPTMKNKKFRNLIMLHVKVDRFAKSYDRGTPIQSGGGQQLLFLRKN